MLTNDDNNNKIDEEIKTKEEKESSQNEESSLKPKKKNVSIVALKIMEVLAVMNVTMKKIPKEKIQIILFVKIVIL